MVFSSPSLSGEAGGGERARPKRRTRWYVYLLQCADGTYYSGVALDLKERLRKHNAGRGARYTRGRRPVRLVWSLRCSSYAQARAREAQLKRWSRADKRRLAQGSLRLPSR
jgi:putative endonuclease